jgi:pimeloyl-ACP methyl ester carboxylesterase
MRRLAALAAAAALISFPLGAMAAPAAVVADPPVAKDHRASMYAFALPSHGVNINAVLYTAAGDGAHPTVLLLHGLPGNEQNLDLAQAMRRAGWNVLTMHYRGSWGTPGVFTFGGVLEDADAALAWLRAPENAKAHGIDANKIVVAGHSMGGWAAVFAGGHDRNLAGVVLISAADMGRSFASPREQVLRSMDSNIGTSAGMHTLNATPESLADDIAAHGKAWDFKANAPGLALHPLLVVSSDDGLAPGTDALAIAVGKGVTKVHLATDHSYSDQRIALQSAVVDWLATLKP